MRARKAPSQRVESLARLNDRTLVVTDDGEDGVEIGLPGLIEMDDGTMKVTLTAGLVPDDRGGDWRVAATKLVIAQSDGRSPIDAEVLRRVSTSDLIDRLLSDPSIAYSVRPATAIELDNDPHRWRRRAKGRVDPKLLAQAKRQARLGRGVRRDPAQLERVANAYRGAAPRKRLRAVADDLKVSTNYAKKLLREARDAGILEQSTRSAPDS